jgi:predicted secreted protein
MGPDPADEVLELRAGEQHLVRLPGLGTAGYRWSARIEGDPAVAAVREAGQQALPGEALGASAGEAYSIHPNRAGEVLVRFEQRRPWEPEGAEPAAEHTVRVRVT